MSINSVAWKRKIIGFLSAQTISLFGSSLVQYAIIWYITLSTSSGMMLMISTLCGFLPQVAISLFAGVWVDRYDRKKIIMLVDAMIAAATLVLAIAFFMGCENIWFLFAVLVIRSVGTGIQTPAVNAIIPQIVPAEQLMRVNGINSTLASMMMFLSPAVSAAVLSIAPFAMVLILDVITAIIGIGVTSVIKVAAYQREETEQSDVLKEIQAGFAYLKQNRFISRLIAYQLTILFLISPSAFMTPLMVSRTFGADLWRLSASEMTYSLGMVLGGMLIAAWGGFQNRLHTTLLAGMVYGAVMIGLGTAPVFWIYLIFNILIGVTAPCYNAPLMVSVQERVEAGKQGRVFSLLQIASSCALPLGMVLFGPLGDVFPVGWILAFAGSIVFILSLFLWQTRYFAEK